MSESWQIVEHNWSDTGIYAGERRIASLSIAEEATEETQAVLEDRMAAEARLIAAAPDLLAACRALLRAGERDGRYLAISQQDEWARAVRLADEAIEKAGGG